MVKRMRWVVLWTLSLVFALGVAGCGEVTVSAPASDRDTGDGRVDLGARVQALTEGTIRLPGSVAGDSADISAAGATEVSPGDLDAVEGERLRDVRSGIAAGFGPYFLGLLAQQVADASIEPGDTLSLGTYEPAGEPLFAPGTDLGQARFDEVDGDTLRVYWRFVAEDDFADDEVAYNEHNIFIEARYDGDALEGFDMSGALLVPLNDDLELIDLEGNVVDGLADTLYMPFFADFDAAAGLARSRMDRGADTDIMKSRQHADGGVDFFRGDIRADVTADRFRLFTIATGGDDAAGFQMFQDDDIDGGEEPPYGSRLSGDAEYYAAGSKLLKRITFETAYPDEEAQVWYEDPALAWPSDPDGDVREVLGLEGGDEEDDLRTKSGYPLSALTLNPGRALYQDDDDTFYITEGASPEDGDRSAPIYPFAENEDIFLYVPAGGPLADADDAFTFPYRDAVDRLSDELEGVYQFFIDGFDYDGFLDSFIEIPSRDTFPVVESVTP